MSGARLIWPFSATWMATSCSREAARGTSSVEPALISMLWGMPLTARKSFSFMPTRLAASAGFIVAGAIQAVQLASWPPL